MDFKEAESRYSALKGRLEGGELGREEFQAQVGQLRVKDEHGHHWAIDARSGGWLLYDGVNWVPARLPEEISHSSRPNYSQAPPRRGLPVFLIGAAAVAVLLCLMAVGGAGLILSRSRGVEDEAVISQDQARRIADQLIAQQFPDLTGAERAISRYENPAGGEFWSVTYRRQVETQVGGRTYTIPRIVIVSVDMDAGETTAAVSD